MFNQSSEYGKIAWKYREFKETMCELAYLHVLIIQLQYDFQSHHSNLSFLFLLILPLGIRSFTTVNVAHLNREQTHHFSNPVGGKKRRNKGWKKKKK